MKAGEDSRKYHGAQTRKCCVQPFGKCSYLWSEEIYTSCVWHWIWSLHSFCCPYIQNGTKKSPICHVERNWVRVQIFRGDTNKFFSLIQVLQTVLQVMVPLFIVNFILSGIMARWYDGCLGWDKTVSRIQSLAFSTSYLRTEKSSFYVKKGAVFDAKDIRGKKIGTHASRTLQRKKTQIIYWWRKLAGVPGNKTARTAVP